jgi:hypothetical protein
LSDLEILEKLEWAKLLYKFKEEHNTGLEFGTMLDDYHKPKHTSSGYGWFVRLK